jgi:hypothetical protein
MRSRIVAGEAGQAAPEWVCTVLLVTVALGALAAFRAPWESDRGVGEMVANRIACAGRGACVGAPGGVPSARPGVASPARPAALPPVKRARSPVTRARSTVTRTPSPVTRMPSPVTRARAIDALRRLRAVSATLVKRAWIVCIGYRRFRYELEHPRAPNQVMPLAEAVDIANGCLNPYGFLVED